VIIATENNKTHEVMSKVIEAGYINAKGRINASREQNEVAAAKLMDKASQQD
jgi:hypothetical protein